MPVLTIIVASTRPGRVGGSVGEWMRSRAVEHGAFDVDVQDLLVRDLPLMNEPNHPRLRDYTHAHTREWSEDIDRADAVVLVIPEYNHSYSAPLKNAIDFLHTEWAHKPVGLVSYGGIAAGTRAAEAITPVLTVLKMVPLPEAVTVPMVARFIDDDGAFHPDQIISDASTTMLDALARWEKVLRPLREQSRLAPVAV